MSHCTEKSNFPITRSGEKFLSFQSVLRTEKAIKNLSPDLKRSNEKKQQMLDNKVFFVFVSKKIAKRLNEAQLKKEKAKPFVTNFKQIHWLDY